MPELILNRFEDALAAGIVASGFMFSDPNEFALEFGRNVFVQDMPVGEQIKQVHSGFDLGKEPVLAIFTESNVGVGPSSSRGGKLEWIIRLDVRLGVVPERAKELLEELFGFLADEFKGVKLDAPKGKYKINGVLFVQRPDIFRRSESGQIYASGTMRFMVVMTVT